MSLKDEENSFLYNYIIHYLENKHIDENRDENLAFSPDQKKEFNRIKKIIKHFVRSQEIKITIGT